MAGESADGTDSTATRLPVGVFRPDDGRLDEAVELLESLGARPVPDPMLAVVPTGATPADGADVVVLTSTTGAELIADAGWDPGDATVAAIGATTAAALEGRGYAVDVVPDEYSSRGLVDALADRVGGARVEVARSDHGSPVLLEGLAEAGADVQETVLYELERPDGAGDSTERAAAGGLEAALFTSTLTVEHFVECATQRGLRAAALSGLEEAVVGAIGEPTAATLRGYGIADPLVPERADFEELACAVVEAASPSYEE